jgi:hypothetical protein
MSEHKLTMRCWAIAGTWGSSGKPFLYLGTWELRSKAIEYHTRNSGRTWKECRAKGDRCVRVTVTEEAR